MGDAPVSKKNDFIPGISEQPQSDEHASAPGAPQRVEDLATLIEQCRQTLQAGRYSEALSLYLSRLHNDLYYRFGAYETCVELLGAFFPGGEDRPSHLEAEKDQAEVLNMLANALSLSGEPHRAARAYEQCLSIYERRGAGANVIIVLANLLHEVQIPTGAFREAEADLQRVLTLCREHRETLDEAIGHQDWARLLGYRGLWEQAEVEIRMAQRLHDSIPPTQHKIWAWWIEARCALLRLRERRLAGEVPRGELEAAVAKAQQALKMADEWKSDKFPAERHYIRAHWLLGAACRMAGDLDSAERELHEAFVRCGRSNNVISKCDILIDMARLSQDKGEMKDARRLAEEALAIADRSGYVLQGADAHLELARLAHARKNLSAARGHAQMAKDLAYCDGPPDYTYKVAYEEAVALLTQWCPGQTGQREAVP